MCGSFAPSPICPSPSSPQRRSCCTNPHPPQVNWNAATAHGCASADTLPAEMPEDVVDIESLLKKPVDVREMPEAEFDKLLLPIFCFAFHWTLGSCLDSRSRTAFCSQAEKWFDQV